MLDDFSIGIVLYTESVVQDTSDVVVPEEEGGQVGEKKAHNDRKQPLASAEIVSLHSIISQNLVQQK